MDILPPNKTLEKTLNRWAIAISVVVFLVVVSMRRIKISTEIDFSFLPAFHSSVNAITAVVLLLALFFIKKGRASMHRKFMTLAVILSVIFLVSYVVYHLTTPETLFCGTGAVRYVYFFLLITHIILAAIILPFILFTYIRAYTNQFDKHKRMARWVFPIWLYVAITGPVLYLFLAPCYG